MSAILHQNGELSNENLRLYARNNLQNKLLGVFLGTARHERSKFCGTFVKLFFFCARS